MHYRIRQLTCIILSCRRAINTSEYRLWSGLLPMRVRVLHTMYVRMYRQQFQHSMDQPGKVANPPRGQLNRINEFSLSPFVHENLVSPGWFSRPAPRQPTHSPKTGRIINLVLTHGIPPAFHDSVHHIYRQPPSGQSQVNRVTQLRTNGIPRREFVGNGPVVLKAVRVTGAAFSGFTMDQFLYASLFLYPPLILLIILV